MTYVEARNALIPHAVAYADEAAPRTLAGTEGTEEWANRWNGVYLKRMARLAEAAKTRADTAAGTTPENRRSALSVSRALRKRWDAAFLEGLEAIAEMV